jgi:hypothetical protein
MPPAAPARRAPGAPGNPAVAPAAVGDRGARVSNNHAHFAFTPFRQLSLPLGAPCGKRQRKLTSWYL